MMNIVDKNYKDRYTYRSVRWSLCNEDFSDLNVDEIAEIFGLKRSTIYKMIQQIKEFVCQKAF